MVYADVERDERWLYFGLFLRYLRSRAGLDVDELVQLFAAVKFVIMRDEIEALERGSCIPRHPQRFLRAVYSSLTLDKSSIHALARYLAFHIVAGEHGAETGEFFLSWGDPARDWRPL